MPAAAVWQPPCSPCGITSSTTPEPATDLRRKLAHLLLHFLLLPQKMGRTPDVSLAQVDYSEVSISRVTRKQQKEAYSWSNFIGANPAQPR
jgi:hypothetical protein